MKHSSTLSVGPDVHVHRGRLVSDAKDAEVLYLNSIRTRQSDIDKLIPRLHSTTAQLVFVYEAGPCGYWLYRYLTKKRLLCWVVAPSLIPKKPALAPLIHSAEPPSFRPTRADAQRAA